MYHRDDHGRSDVQRRADPDSWRWSNRLGQANLQAIGPISYELVRRWHDWVNRRVATIDMTSDVTVRLQMSIDFRLPSELPRGLLLGGVEVHMVPLLFLARDSTLSYFDARDETGRSVPLLTRQDNNKITSFVLTEGAKHALRKDRRDGLTLEEKLLVNLAAIPKVTRGESRGLLAKILAGTDAELFPDPEVAEVLLADPELRNLLALCTTSSILHVPLEYEPGRRRIIKVAWDQQWGRSRDEERTGRTRVQSALSTIAWRPWSRWLPQDHIGGAASHHVQLVVPPELELTSAHLATREPQTFLATLAEGGSPDPPNDQERTHDPFSRGAPARSERVHLYVQGAREQRVGFVTIGVRASRQGFLPIAATIAWAVAVALFFLWRNAHDIIGRSEVAAALLLIVPAVSAGFLIRPQEHAVATRVLRFPRLMTTFVAGIPMFAAAVLVIVSEPEQPRLLGLLHLAGAPQVDQKLSIAWMTSSIVTAILAAGLTTSWLLPRMPKSEGTAGGTAASDD